MPYFALPCDSFTYSIPSMPHPGYPVPPGYAGCTTVHRAAPRMPRGCGYGCGAMQMMQSAALGPQPCAAELVPSAAGG